MKRLILIGALVLAGCATKPAQPRVETLEVKLPVSVPCAPTLPPKPAYAADAVDLGADLFALVQALLIDREQRKEREAVLEGAIDGCR